jgi:hypothetical protein
MAIFWNICKNYSTVLEDYNKKTTFAPPKFKHLWRKIKMQVMTGW